MKSNVYNILKKINVLIVEDDNSLLEVMKNIISPYTKCVYFANNGEDGLIQFHSNQIDLIISDINMVPLSGINMAKEIRRFDPNIPIIFITAYDTDENIMNSIAVKSKNFLKKPFDKSQLLIAIVLAVTQNVVDTHVLYLLHGFSYNIETKSLYHDAKEIELTRTEQRLLYLLFMHRNHTVTFDMIELYTWQEKRASPDTIRNYINRLRNKIYPDLIKNVQGIGYQLYFNS